MSVEPGPSSRDPLPHGDERTTEELLQRARRIAGRPGTPPYGFDEFARRATARRRRRLAGRRAVAVGALALLAGAGLANWSAWQPAQVPSRALVGSAISAPTYADQTWLAALPAEPAVVSVETRMAVAELEDRIAWIDDTLSASNAHGDVLARIDQLENERARLVDSLVRVRYAEQLVAANR